LHCSSHSQFFEDDTGYEVVRTSGDWVAEEIATVRSYISVISNLAVLGSNIGKILSYS
jgi:hypothetical protein